MSDTFNYTIADYEGAKLIEAAGYLSANTNIEFIDFLETVTETDNVIIDMQQVDLLTSSGVESLVMLSRNARKKGKRVILARTKPEIKNIFASLSMYNLVIFADTPEDGLVKIRYYT